MANLTQTAANVGLEAAGAAVSVVRVGEAITQGMPIYLNSADGKYYKASAGTSPASTAAGIALTPAATDGYIVSCSSGSVDLGATLTVGTTYVVSATAGAIAPVADMATGNYVTILGIATAASTLVLDINVSGAVTP